MGINRSVLRGSRKKRILDGVNPYVSPTKLGIDWDPLQIHQRFGVPKSGDRFWNINQRLQFLNGGQPFWTFPIPSFH
jgi:hypothetical protein